ncbi:MAG: hypothetical protein ABR568_17330 [Pyrinomonadaceae bacterium]
MNSGVLIWLIIFALATTCFFVVAAIVAVKGSSDLRDLLRDSKARIDERKRS